MITNSCVFLALAQQMLCQETIFMVIKKFLSMKSNPVLQILSGYFLICLVTNNGESCMSYINLTWLLTPPVTMAIRIIINVL